MIFIFSGRFTSGVFVYCMVCSHKTLHPKVMRMIPEHISRYLVGTFLNIRQKLKPMQALTKVTAPISKAEDHTGAFIKNTMETQKKAYKNI